MPHADSALVPHSITSKDAFWAHVHDQLAALLDGQRFWVTNLSNASALIYHSLLAFPAHFGDGARQVNWCGFYIDAPLFPRPSLSASVAPTPTGNSADAHLALGPFCGKPACQRIATAPGRARGVCADAYTMRATRLVPDVDAYPAHIACDGETKSELVVPLLLHRTKGEAEGGADTYVLGVLDLDCLALGGFDEEDQAGLERIARLVVDACDW